MFDDAHLALLPPADVTEELVLIEDSDPRIEKLAHAPKGTPPESAVQTLTNAAGVTVFQMVEIPVEGVPGRLFVGPLPGRFSPLRGELDALEAFGIRHIFGLVPAIDLEDLYRVPTYVEAAKERFGERFCLLDAIDYEAPSSDEAFEAAVESAERALLAGDRVYVHCGAGCGRAGVFASCLLVRRGEHALEAITRFRSLRGCGPESPRQVAYVVRYENRRAKI